MRIFILLNLFTLLLSASMLDFLDLKRAKEAYQQGNYKEAVKDWSKVDSDEAKFNKGDALYRAKRYREAIDTFKSIKDKKLQFKKLHNLGNSYANIGKIDEAIKSYEEALKIKEDKDTRYNLELLKKKKKEQQKKKNNKSNQKKKQDKNGKDDKNKNEKKGDKNKDKNNKNRDNSKENNKEQKRDRKDKPQEKQKRDREKMKQSHKKPQPISDMEERKWQKALNKRGVNTLMLPLSQKGEKRNADEKPW